MRKFYIFLFLLISVFGASAQWTTNTLVNTEASSTVVGDCRTLSTNDGRTWMAYFKSVGAPNNYEVRAQLLDKNGFKLLGPEGVLVNNAAHPTFTTVFTSAVDASNNLLVAFANASTNIIYVNKISPSGTQLWNSNGISFTNALLPKLGFLSNGDIIISWLSTTALKAPMQRLSAATGATLWPAPIDVQTANASHRSAPAQIIPISGNDFIYVFHNRATASPSSNLWAQRYNMNGVAQWAAPVQLSNKGTAYNIEYAPITANGDTLFIPYNGATGLRTDAFVQRLNPDGTLPWGINGADFALDNTYYEYDTKIAFPSSGDFFWACSRLTNTSQGAQGTYVQKFNRSTGARLLTDNGKVVFPIITPPYIIPLGLTLFSDNSPLLMLGKYNTATNQFIYASKLNNNGDLVWPGDTVALGTYSALKLRMTLTGVFNNQAVGAWVERKGTFDQPYAQPIRTDGTTGYFYLTVATQNSVPATIITNGGTLQMTATVFPSTVNQQVTWSLVPGTTGNATISATGLVTAQLNGNGTVWAKAVSVVDPSVKDSMLVTISGQHIPVTSLKVSTLNNVAPVITSSTGSLQMIATILPANATNPDVTWSIVPVTGAAGISSTGLVTPVNDGTIWAKAVSMDNSALKDSMLITISNQTVTGQLEGIIIYPIPARKEIHLKLLMNHEQLNLQIMDMSGRLMYQELLPANVLRTEKTINLERYAAGMYTIRFSGATINTSFKIMKL